jgi:hypothetical protein
MINLKFKKSVLSKLTISVCAVLTYLTSPVSAVTLEEIDDEEQTSKASAPSNKSKGPSPALHPEGAAQLIGEDGIIRLIFSFSPVETGHNLHCVCRYWRDILLNQGFYRYTFHLATNAQISTYLKSTHLRDKAQLSQMVQAMGSNAKGILSRLQYYGETVPALPDISFAPTLQKIVDTNTIFENDARFLFMQRALEAQIPSAQNQTATSNEYPVDPYETLITERGKQLEGMKLFKKTYEKLDAK